MRTNFWNAYEGQVNNPASVVDPRLFASILGYNLPRSPIWEKVGGGFNPPKTAFILIMISHSSVPPNLRDKSFNQTTTLLYR